MDKPRSVWSPIVPVPTDAPAARLRHNTRGEPLRAFTYRDQNNELLGYTARFLTSSGEAVHLPMTWCADQEGMRGWRWIQFARFRPVYGLEQISESVEENSSWVVIVFDENEAEAGKKLIPWARFVSWPGGIRKIDEVDWSVLREQNIVIWPTLSRDLTKVRRDDETGGAILPREKQSNWVAALKLEKILLGFNCKILGLVNPFDQPDLPDDFGPAIAELHHWDEKRITDYIFANAGKGIGTEAEQRVRKMRGETVDADPPAEAVVPEFKPDASWEFRLIRKNGELVNCLANVHDCIVNSPEWKGVVAFNDFSMAVDKRVSPPYEHGAIGEWTSTDDSRTAMELSRKFRFTPSSALIMEAIEVIARENSYHPVRDWLRSLKWDGISRVDDWLSDYLGVPKTEYSWRIARWFLMGMVARVMQPGVKFDYCLVLEGSQGRLKSTALNVLGGEWFGDTDINLDNKDSMTAIRGKWLYEFQELGSLAKHESSKQKSFISRRTDEFRPVYGRREIKCPRQGVFTGTTNEELGWNKDPTGGRRFWPIPILSEINIQGLKDAREQLFAEALSLFDSGERFHPTGDEQKKIFDSEQLAREQQDSLVDILHDWVEGQYKDFSLATAAMDGLKMDASKLTKDLQTRVGYALKKLGCTRVEKRNGMIRYWYRPPQKPAKNPDDISIKKEDDDEPF
jgi:predicted P-loop ATPase